MEKAATVVREGEEQLEPFAVKFIAAAHLLDVSESTVRKLAKQGRLKAVLVGADQRVLMSSIKDYLGGAAA